jgi:hypothetical protein
MRGTKPGSNRVQPESPYQEAGRWLVSTSYAVSSIQGLTHNACHVMRYNLDPRFLS